MGLRGGFPFFLLPAESNEEAFKKVMITFILTFSLTFGLLLAALFTLSYCKRRQSKTRHGLSGMCHKTGGTMCASCGDNLLHDAKKPAPGSIAGDSLR